MRSLMKRAIVSASLIWVIGVAFAPCTQAIPAPAEIIRIWPGQAPDEPGNIGEERDTTTPDDHLVDGRSVMRITNVTSPELHYYPAPGASANGTSVIIYPGGGYHVLAWDLEGTEVAEWLNSLGVSAWVLKYRVPKRQDDMVWKHAFQDAQRAVSLVRSEAQNHQLNPDRIGVLGFSAGGNLTFLSSAYNGKRLYPPKDAVDSFSWRPDFAVLIYPAWLAAEDNINLAPQFSVTGSTPPMFFAHAANDPVTPFGSIAAFSALKKADIPAEIHIFPDGGHGYGMRRTNQPVTHWPELCAEWMRQSGWLKKSPAHLDQAAAAIFDAMQGDAHMPALARDYPSTTLDDAYLIQKMVVERIVKNSNRVFGYKGGAVSAAAKKKMGLTDPLSAVLFQEGYLEAGNKPTIQLSSIPHLKIETEIGFVIGETIQSHLNDVKALKRRVDAIVPIIELPGGRGMNSAGMPMIDMIARNAGSAAFIVGEEADPQSMDTDKVFIELTHNGSVVNVARGDEADGGQWLNLLHQVNHAVAQGYTSGRAM